MLTESINLIGKITGSLLAAVAIGVQVGNIMICVVALFFGQAVVLRLLVH
jgi:hypothetical protein